MKKLLAVGAVSLAAALFAGLAPAPKADAFAASALVSVTYGEYDSNDFGFEYSIQSDNTAKIEYVYVYGSAATLTIPSTVDGHTVTAIGDEGFSGVSCNIVLPDTIKEIGSYAFSNSGITSITLPPSLTTLGEGAFYNCESLRSVTVMNGLKAIPDQAFAGCTALSSINLGNVLMIGDRAFENCTSLKTVTVPKTVMSIGERAIGYTGESDGEWVYDEETEDGYWKDIYYKIDGVTIRGVKGSAAETYATENEIPFTAAELRSFDECTIKLAATSYTYNGTARKPAVTITCAGKTLVSGTDYSIAYSDNKNAGTAKITILGLGDTTGGIIKTFKINKLDLSNSNSLMKVTIPYASYTYRGRGIKPTVTVKYDGTKLTTADYTVTFSNNTNVGTATIKVTAKGSNTTGTFTRTFTVKPLALTNSNLKVSIPYASYTYRGRGIKPSVTVKYGSSDKLPTSDYTITYSNNTNVGTAYITVKAKSSNLTGSYKRTFTVKKLNFTSDSHLKVTIPYAFYSYTGSAIKPAVTVKYGSSDKLTTADYKVTYSNNTRVGTATIKVTAKGSNTTGSYSRTFTVKPAKTTMSLATTGTKVKISWNKSGDADGYEIWWCKGCYSKMSFSMGGDDFDCWNECVKLTTITKVGTTSYTKSGLDNRTVYHFKVRSYKKVNGTTLYGNFSNIENSVAAESRLNGATVGSKKTTFKQVDYQVKGNPDKTYTLTAEEKGILDDFAKAHFKSGWTPAQKAIYTANWIHNNFKYLWGTDYANAQAKCWSFVKRCFYYKSGQCCDYNGGFVAMMNYLGFDARLVKGYRNGGNQHFWGEIDIGGYTYLLEVGDKQYDSPAWGYVWAFLCQRYSETNESGSYDKFGKSLAALDI